MIHIKKQSKNHVSLLHNLSGSQRHCIGTCSIRRLYLIWLFANAWVRAKLLPVQSMTLSNSLFLWHSFCFLLVQCSLQDDMLERPCNLVRWPYTTSAFSPLWWSTCLYSQLSDDSLFWVLLHRVGVGGNTKQTSAVSHLSTVGILLLQLESMTCMCTNIPVAIKSNQEVFQQSLGNTQSFWGRMNKPVSCPFTSFLCVL